MERDAKFSPAWFLFFFLLVIEARVDASPLAAVSGSSKDLGFQGSALWDRGPGEETKSPKRNEEN